HRSRQNPLAASAASGQATPRQGWPAAHFVQGFSCQAVSYQHNPFTGGPVLKDHSALRCYVPAPGPWLPILPHIVPFSVPAREGRQGSVVVSHMRCIGSAPAKVAWK